MNGNTILERTIPVKKVMTEEDEVCVTTVYDLTLANYGVNRGLGGKNRKISMMMYRLHLHGKKK